MKRNRSCVLPLALIMVGCQPDTEPVVRPAEPEVSLPTGQLSKEILAKCKESTVLIGNFEAGTIKSTGTGFFVDEGKAIITNHHVVAGSDNQLDPLKVVINPGLPNARIIEVDAARIGVLPGVNRKAENYNQLDVAIIWLDKAESSPLTIGDSKELAETQPVWAFGFPDGIKIRIDGEELPTPTVHAMRVERLQLKKEKVKVLQLAGSPTYGDSGGPVVNEQGEVIGVMHAIQEKGLQIVYAVPSLQVRDLLKLPRSSKVTVADLLKPLKSATSTAVAAVEKVPVQSEKVYSSGPSILGSAYLSEDDLEAFSPRELTLLRNEPFARRGYIFKRAELRSHFAALEWYSPRVSNTSAVQKSFTRTENQNIDLIQQFQRKTGRTW